MKAFLIAVAALAFSAIGFAAPPNDAGDCDLTLTMEVTYKTDKVATSLVTYYGLNEASVQDLIKRSDRILDTASKQQGAKGNYSIEFGKTYTCAGKVSNPPHVVVDGLRINGMTATFKAAQRESDALIKLSDDEHAKGKKRVWGKE